MEGVTADAKETCKGACPVAGEAVASQAREHVAVTVMTPLWEQGTPSAMTVRVQVNEPAEA